MIDAANYDVLIGIDRRGVATVLKHRTADTRKVQAEVKLTTTTVATETFTTEEPADTGLLQEPQHVADVWRKSLVVGVDAAGIKDVLRNAIADGKWVRIAGRKVNGLTYHDRLVRPISINGGTGTTLNEYLYCEDSVRRDTRTFRLDGLERVEIVELAS